MAYLLALVWTLIYILSCLYLEDVFTRATICTVLFVIAFMHWMFGGEIVKLLGLDRR